MKTTVLVAAGLLTFCALPALGQSTNVGVSGGVSANVAGGGTDVSAGASTDVSAGASTELPKVNSNAATSAAAGASASASAAGSSTPDKTYGSLISSISTAGHVDFSTVTDEANVTIILVSSLQGDAANDSSALDTALAANASATTKLHGDIEGNAVIKAKLTAAGYASDDVVAIKTAVDSSVIVYVDDRS